MARTLSKMVSLQTKAHPFNLKNYNPLFKSEHSSPFSLEDLKGERGTLIMFICNHCPYVQLLLDKIIEFATIFNTEGINFIGINSNDVKTYPDDDPVKMSELCKIKKIPFPYLFDETQEVAKIYEATCTPDFFLYDKNLELKYRGRFDSATPGNNQIVTGDDISIALKALLNDSEINLKQEPSMGCNIKWK